MFKCIIVGGTLTASVLVARVVQNRHKVVAEAVVAKDCTTISWPDWEGGSATFRKETVEEVKQMLEPLCRNAEVAFIALPNDEIATKTYTDFFTNKGLRVFSWPHDIALNTEDKAAYMVHFAEQAYAASTN